MFSISFPSTEPRGILKSSDLRAQIFEAHKAAQADISTPREFTVSHAKIEGHLDLASIQKDKEGALLGLVFHDCEIVDSIIIENSTLSSLLISRSRFKSIQGRSAHILGNISLLKVQSSEDAKHATRQIDKPNWHGGRGPDDVDPTTQNETTDVGQEARAQGRCEVHLSGARIEGKIEIKRSRIVGKGVRTGLDLNNSLLNYALNLETAYLGGSLQIDDRSAVLGGISIGGTQINQNVFVVGTRIKGGEGAAVRAQRAKIDGFVALRNHLPPNGKRARTEITGSVDFMAARISSALDISGAKIEARTPSEAAMTFRQAEVDSLLANVDLEKDGLPTEFVGLADFGNIHIREDAVFYSTRFRQLRSLQNEQNGVQINTTLLSFQQAKIDGTLQLYGDFSGPCTLNYASIGKNLVLGAPKIENVLRLRTPTTSHVAFGMQGLHVGGQLAVQNLVVDSKNNFEVVRQVLKGKEPIKTRTLPLSFLPDAQVVEFSVTVSDRPHYGYLIQTAGKVALMDGGGQPVASPLIKNHVVLDDDESILNYIRLFCSIVVGPAGPFRIIEPGDWFTKQLPIHLVDKIKPLKVLPAEARKDYKELCRCSATIWYGSGLFHATLVINAGNFMVDMVDDMPIAAELPELTWSASPLFYAINGSPKFSEDWDLPPPIPGEAAIGIMSKALRKKVLRAIPSKGATLIDKPTISLRNAHVHELSDFDGNLWPRSALLDLAGFTYDAVQINTDRTALLTERNKKRQKWQKNRVKKLLYWPARNMPERIGRGIGICVGVAMVVGIAALLAWFAKGVFTGWDNDYQWSDFTFPAIIALVIVTARYRSVNTKFAKTTFLRRRQFLRLQYENFRPTRQEFSPQPFEQLARVLRHCAIKDKRKNTGGFPAYVSIGKT